MTTAEKLSAKDIQKALAEPFDPYDIEWRIGQAGTKEDRGEVTVWAKCLAYVTNRAIMHRLDEVVGIGNWKNEYRPWMPVKDAKGRDIYSQICTLSLKIDGEWIAKEDGADCSEMEPVKGGLSDAMKRAAYQWGIGRYLYDLESDFATTRTQRPTEGYWKFAKTNEKDKASVAYWWQPPKLPDWALPKDMREKQPDLPADPPAEAPPLSNAEKNAALDAKRQASVKKADAILERLAAADWEAADVAEKYVCGQYDAGVLHDFDYRRCLIAILDRRIAIAVTEDQFDETERQFLEYQSRKWLLGAQIAAMNERLETRRAKHQEAF